MELFKWRQARSTDISIVKQLLSEREDAWISLIDRLKNAGNLWHEDFWLLDATTPRTNRLAACFYISATGLGILAVSPDFNEDLREDQLIRAARKRILKLFCLMGTAEHVLKIQYSLSIIPIASTRYWLMSRPSCRNLPPEPSTPSNGYRWPLESSSQTDWRSLAIRRARIEDASDLFELQCMYEIEEVLVPGHRLHPDQTRRQLDLSVTQHCIYLAASGSVMVGKAGTNGLGWRWVQIGGVYTLPEWRGRGIGEQLMKAVLQDIFSAGLGACLFVKQQNAPALRLYDKLGFNPTGELIISYY